MHESKTTNDKTTKSSPKVPPHGAHLSRSSDKTLLDELKSRLQEIDDLLAACSVLSWDQATYMPRGGAPARSRQGATLHRLAHQHLVDPAIGRLLDALAPFAERLSPDSDDASLIRVARRDFEKALKVPPDHVARTSALGSAAYDAWTRARPANDFATMLPFLEQAVELSREYANFFAPYRRPSHRRCR
jgi:carboxypeptidase Taq